MRHFFWITTFLILTITSNLNAQILLYDNGGNFSSSVFGDEDFGQRNADDVTLSENALVTRIEWSGNYTGPLPAVDDFKIEFYDDNFGQPGDLIQTFNVGNDVNRVPMDGFQYSAEFNFLMRAGQKYFIAIVNDTTGEPADWLWNSNTNGVGTHFSNDGGVNWAANQQRPDFRLFGDPTRKQIVIQLSGKVGSDPSATSPLGGSPAGNNNWILNGTALEAGAEVKFQYAIDPSATSDTNPSGTAGQFAGGQLLVSIPSMCINNVPAGEDYVLDLSTGATTNEIQFRPVDSTGLRLIARYPSNEVPFTDPNDIDSITQILPSLTGGDFIGTAGGDANFQMTLANGDSLSTEATELTVDPVCEQVLPFPSRLRFTAIGLVGSDSGAVSPVDGTTYGNNSWSLNGSNLAAGTLINFTYEIFSDVVDTDPDPAVGRFPGGTLTVSIPSQGFSDTPDEPYVVKLATLPGITDLVSFEPADGTGPAYLARWLDADVPFKNPNTLKLVDNVPAIGDIIGTSANSDFQLTLNGGATLTTAFTELLVNSVFEPETIIIFNDFFDDESYLIDLPGFSDRAHNFTASVQQDEQEILTAGATVWWFFNAPFTGTVTFNTLGSDFDTELHVFEGFVANGFPNLTLVAGNDQGPEPHHGDQSEVTFDVVAGTCYEVRVGGWNGDTGNIVLNGDYKSIGIVGDVNCDGVINLLDVGPFVDAISAGEFAPKADINQDGVVNLLDVGPFVTLLSGS